jgi:hypothetical protein
MEEDSSSLSTSNEVSQTIPDGAPKSGRIWKKKQTVRSSTSKRQGVLKHLSSTFEKRKLLVVKEKQVKDYEKELKDQTKQKKQNERLKREENQKRRMANEYKSVVTQQVPSFPCFRLCRLYFHCSFL